MPHCLLLTGMGSQGLAERDRDGTGTGGWGRGQGGSMNGEVMDDYRRGEGLGKQSSGSGGDLVS